MLDGLADAPFSAPDTERMRELGWTHGRLRRRSAVACCAACPGSVVLARDASERAARILASLPQPFTAAAARQALGTTRRMVISLLDWAGPGGNHPAAC